jgi:hypothetical protein
MGKEYYRDIEFLTTRLNPSEGKQNVDLKTIGEDFPMGLYQGLFSLINFKYEPGMAPKPAKQVKEPSSDNEPKPAEEPSSNKEPKSFDIKPIPSNDTIKGNEVMGKNSLKENNMKNIVRKNLLEVKNKKNSQLSENKIVKSRFFILTENKQPKTKKEIFVVLEDVKKEINYLQSQNFNNELIAEQALDYLQSVLPDAKLGIVETFKEYVVGLILKTMGVDTNGWIATIVQTTIASVPVSDLPKLLSDCHYTSNVLTKSIIKGIIYKFQKEKGMDNAFMNILRNTMIEVVEDSAKNLENKLSDLICNKLKNADFKMGDMVDNLKSHIADFSL